MITSEQKIKDKKLRLLYLDIQKTALKNYQRTKDSEVLEYAKYFGEKSRELST